MDLTHKGKRWWVEFENVYDLQEFITNPKYHQPEASAVSHKVVIGSDEQYYGTKNYQEAMDLMQYGWPEGRERVEKFTVEIEKLVMRQLPEVEIQYGVQGDVVDIGRLVTGHPESMMSFQETEEFRETAKGKIIHITVNICAAWFYSPEAFFRRGGAAVALIDALERMGHRCICDCIVTISSPGYYDTELLETRVRVKNPNEGVQLDKLAFLFGHASVLRRVMFAAWERLPEFLRTKFGIVEHGGYGRVQPVPKEDEGDILVDGLLEEKYADTGTLSKWVLDRLREQGILLREEV